LRKKVGERSIHNSLEGNTVWEGGGRAQKIEIRTRPHRGIGKSGGRDITLRLTHGRPNPRSPLMGEEGEPKRV